MTTGSWPPERETALRLLWLAGATCREIAWALNTSKNAVIGRINWLGLPTRSGIERKPRGEADLKRARDARWRDRNRATKQQRDREYRLRKKAERLGLPVAAILEAAKAKPGRPRPGKLAADRRYRSRPEVRQREIERKRRARAALKAQQQPALVAVREAPQPPPVAAPVVDQAAVEQWQIAEAWRALSKAWVSVEATWRAGEAIWAVEERARLRAARQAERLARRNRRLPVVWAPQPPCLIAAGIELARAADMRRVAEARARRIAEEDARKLRAKERAREAAAADAAQKAKAEQAAQERARHVKAIQDLRDKLAAAEQTRRQEQERKAEEARMDEIEKQVFGRLFDGPDPTPQMLLDIRIPRAGRCSYIPGDTKGPETVYCAAPVERPGASYCRACREICWVKTSRQVLKRQDMAA